MPGLLADEIEEDVGVGRVAHGARRDRLDLRGADLSREHHHVSDFFRRRADRVVGQLTALGEPSAETRAGSHFVHDANGAVGRYVGDDLADGVRADIDRGDPPRQRCLVASVGAGARTRRSGGAGAVRQETGSGPRSDA